MKSFIFLLFAMSILSGVVSIVMSAEMPNSVEGKKLPSSTLSIREQIANFKYIAAIISIDDYTTYFFPERNNIFGKRVVGAEKEFTAELTSICDTQFEVLDTDPITSQIKWVLWDGKQDLYHYWLIDKVTGKRIERIGFSDKSGFQISSRCKDRFDIKPNGWFIYIMDRGFIHHKVPQPYVLKFLDLASEQIYMPPDGEIKNMYWEKDESKRKKIPFSFTLFAYFNALCRKLNNDNVKIRYITDNKEVSPLYLFEKVIEPYDMAKDWYLSCEGAKSFLLREIVYKDYVRQKSSANKKILFQSNRTADDLLKNASIRSPEVETEMPASDIKVWQKK